MYGSIPSSGVIPTVGRSNYLLNQANKLGAEFGNDGATPTSAAPIVPGTPTPEERTQDFGPRREIETGASRKTADQADFEEALSSIGKPIAAILDLLTKGFSTKEIEAKIDDLNDSVKESGEGVSEVKVTNIDEMAAPINELGADVTDARARLLEVEGRVGEEDVEIRVINAIESNNEVQQSELDAKLVTAQEEALASVESTAVTAAEEVVSNIQAKIDILELLREDLEESSEKQDGLQTRVDTQLAEAQANLEKAAKFEEDLRKDLVLERTAREESARQLDTKVDEVDTKVNEQGKQLTKAQEVAQRADENAKQALHKAPRP